MFTKKKYKYGGKKKYNTGGTIGKIAGAAIGTAIQPGSGTTLGAKLGGQAGSMLEKFAKKEKDKAPINMYGSAYGSGFAQGGYLDFGSMMLPHKYKDGGYRQTYVEKNNPMKAPRRKKKKKKKGNMNVSDRNSSKSMSDMMLSPQQKEYMKHKGGEEESIGQDATKFEGKEHEEGGIDIDKNTEVEDGETKDRVNGRDYVFSKRVKFPGTDKSFAEVHEEMVKNNASPEKIERLAKLQEKVTGRK